MTVRDLKFLSEAAAPISPSPGEAALVVRDSASSPGIPVPGLDAPYRKYSSEVPV